MFNLFLFSVLASACSCSIVLRLSCWLLFCLSHIVTSLNTTAVLLLSRGAIEHGSFWLVLRRVWRCRGFVDLGLGCVIGLLPVGLLVGQLLLLFLGSVRVILLVLSRLFLHLLLILLLVLILLLILLLLLGLSSGILEFWVDQDHALVLQS